MDTISWVFLFIGLIGFGLALINSLVGEISDILPGGFHFGDSFDGHQIMFSQFFNIGTITGILAGFGFGGLFAYGVLDYNTTISSFVGFISSIILAGILNFLYIKLSKATYTSSLNEKDFINKNGVVIDDILPDEIGSVSIIVNDVLHKYPARSLNTEGGKKYITGDSITVRNISSGILYIE